ncbi:Os12g0579700 [Oryza sativa Japonica Group]|uniref:Os12g0579700 protein n=1 Tax=Oryza sativa subsp. japonica TaxID=39947 RepID=A0A0P0YBS6_ORYSJ|nr:Os12g0579700 [Oryza sativa Japonica Group]
MHVYVEQADSTMSVLAGLLAQDQDGDDQEVTSHAAAASTQGDANFTGGLDGVDDAASLWVQPKAKNPLVDDPDLIRFADDLLNLTGKKKVNNKKKKKKKKKISGMEIHDIRSVGKRGIVHLLHQEAVG